MTKRNFIRVVFSVITMSSSLYGQSTYTLEVQGGTGSGVYASGSVVTINAIEPDGMQFHRWLSVNAEALEQVVDVRSSSTTVTVNGDFVLSAQFVPAGQMTLLRAVSRRWHGEGEALVAHDLALALDAPHTVDGRYDFVEFDCDLELILELSHAVTAVDGKIDDNEILVTNGELVTAHAEGFTLHLKIDVPLDPMCVTVELVGLANRWASYRISVISFTRFTCMKGRLPFLTGA